MTAEQEAGRMTRTDPTIELVLFDLGGVLIDWEPRRLYRKIFADEAAMEQFLATVCTPAWNLELDRGRPFAEAVAELVARHPEQREPIEAYHERWIEMIGGPIAPTVAVLDGLKSEGRRLEALTNWSAETFPLVRHDPTYGFLDHFATIYVSGELGMIKPEDDIFHHVLDDVALPAGRVLFIDDSAKNIAAADRLGFATHHFATAEALAADLRRLRLLA
jgi:2-haloacid dehalogenase